MVALYPRVKLTEKKSWGGGGGGGTVGAFGIFVLWSNASQIRIFLFL